MDDELVKKVAKITGRWVYSKTPSQFKISERVRLERFAKQILQAILSDPKLGAAEAMQKALKRLIKHYHVHPDTELPECWIEALNSLPKED